MHVDIWINAVIRYVCGRVAITVIAMPYLYPTSGNTISEYLRDSKQYATYLRHGRLKSSLTSAAKPPYNAYMESPVEARARRHSASWRERRQCVQFQSRVSMSGVE